MPFSPFSGMRSSNFLSRASGNFHAFELTFILFIYFFSFFLFTTETQKNAREELGNDRQVPVV